MEFVIKNLMESVVESRVKELMADADCCKCEKCRMDITAYVLNKLPAKYVSTEKGALFAELDMLDNQHEANIMTNILQAIELIAKNPHHWTPAEAKENGIKKEEMKFDFDVEGENKQQVNTDDPVNPVPQNNSSAEKNTGAVNIQHKNDLPPSAKILTENTSQKQKTENSVSPLSRLSNAVKKTSEEKIHKTEHKEVKADEPVKSAETEILSEYEEETYSSSDFDVFGKE